jgi:murein DD-endopeptidase MepM/ murein hydrolase activator NlpD
VFQVCPVDAPRHFRDDFGDPRNVGGFHRHEGNDIMAPFGTPIRAPFDGRAESSTSWAGGLQIYVYGRQGFAFNSHVSRTGHLGRIRAGQIVGYVGSTGAASGGAVHDHFEWHPNGGPAVDPFPLLTAACSHAERSGAGRRGQSTLDAVPPFRWL